MTAIPLLFMFAAALVVGWLAAEFKGHRVLRICLGLLAVLVVGYTGYRTGRLALAIEYSWVAKERSFTESSMRRIEELLAKSETNTVSKAVAAYYRTADSSTNEFGYYQASLALWEALQERK